MENHLMLSSYGNHGTYTILVLRKHSNQPRRIMYTLVGKDYLARWLIIPKFIGGIKPLMALKGIYSLSEVEPA